MVVKSFEAVRVRVQLKIAQWPENLKAARSGNFMVWSVGSSAAGSDSQGALVRYDEPARSVGRTWRASSGPPSTRSTTACRAIPDGPERAALFAEAIRISIAYMPYKFRVNRIVTDMSYPRLVGYRRPISGRNGGTTSTSTRLRQADSGSAGNSPRGSFGVGGATRMNPLRPDRRRCSAALLALALPTPPAVLRYASAVAETGFDPAQITDLYSRTVTAHIFETLYAYDPLARPDG